MAAVIPLIDRCYLGTISAGGGPGPGPGGGAGQSTAGEPRAVYSYATGTPVFCRVLGTTPGETANGMQIPTDAVRIAFRRDSGVEAGTRIQVYRRLREALAADEYYEVIGAPKIIRRRLMAVCKRTTARSAK